MRVKDKLTEFWLVVVDDKCAQYDKYTSSKQNWGQKGQKAFLFWLVLRAGAQSWQWFGILIQISWLADF